MLHVRQIASSLRYESKHNANELDYPLICVYRIEDGKKSTFFSAADLPNALSALERYVSQTLHEQGYAVGMVTTKQAASGATAPAVVSYQALSILLILPFTLTLQTY